MRRKLDGVLLLDKPVGPSSSAVLQAVKRLLEAEKAGHAGTLDPLASGPYLGHLCDVNWAWGVVCDNQISTQ